MPDQIDITGPTKQMYDSFVPLARSGSQVQISVRQTLTDPKKPEQLLDTGTGTITVNVNGPQTVLVPDAIRGTYPASGSADSLANYLPHIALARRTLPWERTGPDGMKQKDSTTNNMKVPWLALLLVTEEELPGGRSEPPPTSTLDTTTVQKLQTSDPATYTQLHGAGMADDLSITVVTLPNSLLSNILPDIDELALLCHVKSVNNRDTAIVVCNRLPEPGTDSLKPLINTAILVSLENRTDLYGNDSRLKKPGQTTLVALTYWNFTPANGGDFAEVVQQIGVRPNGGVLRFGNLPRNVAPGQAAPLSGEFQARLDAGGYVTPALDHAQPGNLMWRGPLRPFAPPARSQGFAVRAEPEEFADADPSKPLDYSHATAFELGRLLALADSGIREDLRTIRLLWPVPKEIVATSVIPVVFQKPDWVQDQPWQEEPWAFAAQSFTNGLLAAQKADITGIQAQAEAWQNTVNAALGPANGLTVSGVAQVDIATVTATDLATKFPEVVASRGA